MNRKWYKSWTTSTQWEHLLRSRYVSKILLYIPIDDDTFARLTQEIQDMGDRIRMVVVAHRRIKIVSQLMEDIEPLGPKGEYRMTIK